MNRRHMLMTLGGLTALGAETPKRADMRVLCRNPEDYEMPLEGFQDWITPVDRFFVRSHHYTPKVDPASWSLAVSGQIATPLTLTMDDLKKMPPVELVAVLECAGNGRGFYEPSMPGLQWGHGGVGNAKWRGVRLRDVLKRAGIRPEAKQVLFDGADIPVGTQPEFQRTVHVAKAMDPNTLLAFEMNSEALPVSHGFPLRLIVPGWAGDSWVKWIQRIEVLDHDFDGFFMKTGYRHPGKGVEPGKPVPPEQMRPVEEIQIKAVIGSIGPQVTGAAWSGESPVARVEVSADRGRSWQPAKITSPKTPFGWVTWSYDFRMLEGYYVLMARAWDAKGRTQPFAQEWNPSGYQWNVVDSRTPSGPAENRKQGDFPSAPPSYRGACLSCHSEEPIANQRLSRTQWDAEVAKMERWGAKIPAGQRPAIVDYLSDRFPYGKR